MFRFSLILLFLLANIDLASTMYCVHYTKTCYEFNPLMYDLVHNHPIKACIFKELGTLGICGIFVYMRDKAPRYNAALLGFSVMLMTAVCVNNMYNILA